MATTQEYVTKTDLERMLSALGAQLEREIDKRLAPVFERFDALDTKVDALESRFDALDAKVDALSVQVAGIDQKVGELVTWAYDRPNTSDF